MAVVTFTALGAGAAQADDKGGAQPSVKVTEVPMTLACDQLEPKALTYAVDHNYCTADGKSVVSPSGIVPGDCGSSWIWIYNRGNPHQAFFRWGFQSTLGSVIFRSLRISWYNWTTGHASGWPDEDVMNSSYYENTRYEYTGRGYVTTGMAGAVTLWWGGICRGLNPTDGAQIT